MAGTHRGLAGVLAAMALVTAAPAKALLINIDAPGLAGTEALAAFERAARAWEGIFTDPVEVNVSAALLPLGSTTIIGQTTSVLLAGPYDVIRDQMVVDGLAESDDGIVAHLPTAGEFSAILPGFSPAIAFGLDGNLSATKANLKALGFDAAALDAAFGASDALMEFNSAFAFDFDRRDGITPGLTDFETVAAHEIGHVLGFDTVVDTIDVLFAAGLVADVAPRTLDLFRFQEGDAPTTPAEFTSAPRLLVPGFPDFLTFEDQFPAVFSDLDNVYPLSTGWFLGDGRQASHWKDDAYTGVRVGLMDPSLARGESFDITAADIRALDLIGWDYQPAVSEPPSVLLLAMGVMASLCLASRPSKRAHLLLIGRARLRREMLRRAFSRQSRKRLSRASRSRECARARSSSASDARRRTCASG